MIMAKHNLQQQIEEILQYNPYYKSVGGENDKDVVVQESDPFFWRLNPEWVKDKAKMIIKLIKNYEKRKAI